MPVRSRRLLDAVRRRGRLRGTDAAPDDVAEGREEALRALGLDEVAPEDDAARPVRDREGRELRARRLAGAASSPQREDRDGRRADDLGEALARVERLDEVDAQLGDDPAADGDDLVALLGVTSSWPAG